MAEDNVLREKNNEMVKAVQHWKMTAAQKENEKLELKKEVNELRFKLSRLRNAESARARKLNSELQSASEEVLSQLVQASSTVARMLELVKSFMQDREQLESTMPRWSSLAPSTPSTEKINRVYPMVINGKHLQPVVALRRNENIADPPNMNISMRAVPLHMLQVYVPLTRIDARRASRNTERPARSADVNAEENTPNNSTEDLALDDGSEGTDASSDQEDFQGEESSRLEVVTEELELDEGPPQRAVIDDPMEGPSWLLDLPRDNTEINNRRNKLEPDSTTEMHDSEPLPGPSRLQVEVAPPVPLACEFTPTVRRRKRAPPPPPASPRSPHFSPRPPRRNSKDGRVLKVLVAKLRLDEDDGGSGDASPPKRAHLTQAPPKRPVLTETPPRLNPADVPPKVTNHPGTQTKMPDEVPPKRPNNAELPKRRPNHIDVPSKRPNTSETQQKPQKIFHRRRSPESPKRQSTDGSPICHVRDRTPSQLLTRFDAPSPNGSTDSRVIVLESGRDIPEPCCSGVSRSRSRTLSRTNSRENHQNQSTHNASSTNHANNRAVPASQPNHSTNDNNSVIPTSQPNHSNNDNHRATSQPNHSKHNRRDNVCDNNTSEPNHSVVNTAITHSAPNTSSYNQDEFNNVDNSRHSRANRSRLDSHNEKHTGRNGHHASRDENHAGRSESRTDRSENHVGRSETHVGRSESRADRSENHVGRSESRTDRSENHVGRSEVGADSDSSNSDLASEARTRRPRKAVIYKEKPLNRKMRR